MEKAREFLLRHGYTNKDLHDLKTSKKIQKIATQLGLGKIPHLGNIDSKKFVINLFENGDPTADSFMDIFLKVLSSRFFCQVENNTLTEHELVITNLPGHKFYQTKEWRDLRYKVLTHA